MVRSVALFIAWAIVGFVESFALLYFFAVAPLFVAIGWIAYAWLPRVSGSRLPEALGVVAGFGAFWLFLASAMSGATSLATAVGLLSIGIALAGYLALGRSRCRRGLATS